MLRVCKNAFNVTQAPTPIRYFVTPLVERNMNQTVSAHQSERTRSPDLKLHLAVENSAREKITVSG